jgi:predicted nucleic acid-binding protein
MARLSDLTGARIYLDANVVIYAVERLAPFRPAHRELFSAYDRGALTLVTSELTLHECLVKPFANSAQARIDAYMVFLDSVTGVEPVPIGRDILIEAARIRASIKLKAPDAIHYAAAQIAVCTHFLTNDKRIRPTAKLDVLQWDDLEL